MVSSQRPALRAAERQGVVGLLPEQRQGAPVDRDQGLREVAREKRTLGPSGTPCHGPTLGTVGPLTGR